MNIYILEQNREVDRLVYMLRICGMMRPDTPPAAGAGAGFASAPAAMPVVPPAVAVENDPR
jgi:hypothetical protein